MEGDGYDVIGDVHGCAAELVELLVLMGYSERGGAWRHPARQAVFVGDLIDRGPGQVEVLRIVRAMHELGSAQVVMGNHEFNAVAYATPDPDAPGEFLRRHNAKNDAQHAEFLDQIGYGSADHREAIAWFATLPLWLDLGDLRVVHACWDAAAMAGLGDRCLDPDGFVAASRPGAEQFGWVEHLCKGPEVELPGDLSFVDKDGHVRRHARHRWWDPQATSYATGCEVPSSAAGLLPDTPIESPPVAPYGDSVPVLFGHYWRTWNARALAPTAACIDYSCVKGGPLVAYRWSGEPELQEHHLIATGAAGE